MQPHNDFMKIFRLFLFLLISQTIYGQLNFNMEWTGKAQVSNEDRTPFWLHMNQKGRLDPESNFLGLIQAKADMELSNDSYFEMGGGVFYSNGFDNEIRIDQVYAEFLSPKIGVVVGKKHKTDNFRGISASNDNILWSLNAGAIPGIRLFSTDPLFLMGDHGIGVKGSWEEYILDDDRFVENTRIHHKSGHLVYRSRSNFEVSLGFQHFVQWAGKSQEYGQLPNDFDAYTKIVTGAAGDADIGEGQEVNALGNQIGSYEINVKTKVRDLDVHFIYNHIFEDGSGMKMGNFPDGRYALYIEDNRDTFWGVDWLKAVIYEIYYTKNQSRNRVSSTNDGSDNYFNNNLYRSGWTYNNHVIGVPFILLNDNYFRIGNNNVVVHHIGAAGEVAPDWNYKMMLSYRQNYGVKDAIRGPKQQILSSFFSLDIPITDYDFQAYVGSDLDFDNGVNFGGGVKLSASFF